MEGTWICPQCETSNENTDKCIVCGMDYASAVMIYKKYSTEKIEKEKVIKIAYWNKEKECWYI